MRILLTGAAGFLGSHLCDRLIAEGHQVVGMEISLQETKRISLTLRAIRISASSSMMYPITSCPGKIDYVLHFAPKASPNPDLPRPQPNLPIKP